MPNCASAIRRRTLLAAALALLLAAPAVAQTAKARYDAAQSRESDVRAALSSAPAGDAPSGLLNDIARVAKAYEAIVLRYPTSGYCDNALWQGASLHQDAYDKFGQRADRDEAIRLFTWLTREYPHSGFVKQARAGAADLRTTPSRAAAAAKPAPAAPASPAAAPGASTGATPPATLLSIERTVLPDTVRITLELDREVIYHQERIEGPPRLFFDLQDTAAAPELTDQVAYDGDAVSRIRVGRHPDNTVRVVLDLQDVARHSVFTLYSPFRLVIDCERTTSKSTVADAPPVVLPAEAPGGGPAATSVAASDPAPATASAPPPPPSPPPTKPEPAKTEVAKTAPAKPEPAPKAVTPPDANAAGGFSMARQLGLGVSRIVIDPGHGGKDPGAQSRGLNEADLTLDIALRLEKLLKDEPGLEVTLTRRTNVYIPLEERTAIANRENADLFLSIHANASRNQAARGIETYYLSFASSPEAEAVAARENSASDREMHHLPDIIKAIALNNKLDESRDLAAMVQEALVTKLRKSNQNARNLGVKKAPFVVLIGAQMPSVLAEISFITNRQELALLKTSSYKQKIAESLEAAVLKYRRSLKAATAVASQ